MYFHSIGWSSKYTIQHLNLCIRYTTYSKLAFADQRAEGRERSDAISDARTGRSNRSTDRRKEIAGEQSRRSKTTTTTTTTTTNVSCSAGSSGSRNRSGKIIFFKKFNLNRLCWDSTQTLCFSNSFKMARSTI